MRGCGYDEAEKLIVTKQTAADCRMQWHSLVQRRCLLLNPFDAGYQRWHGSGIFLIPVAERLSEQCFLCLNAQVRPIPSY